MGNRVTATCRELTTLRARDGIPDWNEISALLDEWRPAVLVVGNPLNMDGSDSELSRLAGKFARRLEGRFAPRVDLMDERLSSFEARQELREAGHSGDYRESPADAVAARLILQSWLRENANW